MAMKTKAERLRLLHERGRLGRGVLYDGVRYWIGHHQQMGLLIFDPHAQREVETGKVRLFIVADHESRLFMLNIARTRSLWSSPNDHTEEMRKAVIEYGRARERQRETHCYWCRRDINSVDFSLCTRCGWIRCACGNLHPAMQVAFTRQIAEIVRAGVRIIVTTHSEWVLEELGNIVGRSRVTDRGNASPAPDPWPAVMSGCGCSNRPRTAAARR